MHGKSECGAAGCLGHRIRNEAVYPMALAHTVDPNYWSLTVLDKKRQYMSQFLDLHVGIASYHLKDSFLCENVGCDAETATKRSEAISIGVSETVPVAAINGKSVWYAMYVPFHAMLFRSIGFDPLYVIIAETRPKSRTACFSTNRTACRADDVTVPHRAPPHVDIARHHVHHAQRRRHAALPSQVPGVLRLRLASPLPPTTALLLV